MRRSTDQVLPLFFGVVVARVGVMVTRTVFLVSVRLLFFSSSEEAGGYKNLINSSPIAAQALES